jgi:hypothetical protein
VQQGRAPQHCRALTAIWMALCRGRCSHMPWTVKASAQSCRACSSSGEGARLCAAASSALSRMCSASRRATLAGTRPGHHCSSSTYSLEAAACNGVGLWSNTLYAPYAWTVCTDCMYLMFMCVPSVHVHTTNIMCVPLGLARLKAQCRPLLGMKQTSRHLAVARTNAPCCSKVQCMQPHKMPWGVTSHQCKQPL